MGKAQDLSFGDLILDETCLFARRNGTTIQFTRNERALLLAFSRNPQRLMPRSRLLDEIASSETDTSDRNIDFLVNRLRTKLGDSARAPRYIATQYGEGYVWIAAPSAVPVAMPDLAPIDGLLAIVPVFISQDSAFTRQALSLIDQLRDLIAASIGVSGRVVVIDNLQDAAASRMRYVLQVSLQDDDGRLDCAATLREMPTRQIIKAFRLDLDVADVGVFEAEATQVAHRVADVLQQALTHASTGLGTPTDAPLDIRLRRASTLLSSSNPRWLEQGRRLSTARVQEPHNADLALQWCLHLFARLVLANPFTGVSARERDKLESEIEATVLDCLPAIEANPLLMLAAAKLLYFVNRGHLDLAEDIAERAFARIADSAAALPVLGQLRQARGQFNEAVILFDRGIDLADPDSEFLLHMRVLKCIALLASGDRAALDVAAEFTCDPRFCPRNIAVMIGLMMAPAGAPLPPLLSDTLTAAGVVGARNALDFVYMTSARHLTAQNARANVMGGLVAHAKRLHGTEAIPARVVAAACDAR